MQMNPGGTSQNQDLSEAHHQEIVALGLKERVHCCLQCFEVVSLVGPENVRG